MKQLSKYQGTVDLSGAMVSVLCMVHCMATPLLFLTMPALEATARSHHEHSWWGLLDWVFLALSLIAVWYAAKYTTHRGIRFLFWIFWLVFAAGLMVEMYGLQEQKWLMYAGSLSLAITHMVNFRYCRRCNTVKCD